jgi:hypothetical protein
LDAIVVTIARWQEIGRVDFRNGGSYDESVVGRRIRLLAARVRTSFLRVVVDSTGFYNAAASVGGGVRLRACLTFPVQVLARHHQHG